MKSLIVIAMLTLAGCSKPQPKPVASEPVYFKVDPATAGSVSGKILFTGKAEPPQLNPRAMFAAFPLDLALVPNPQHFLLPVQQPRLVQVLADRAGQYDVDIRWGHALAGFDQDTDGVTVHITGPAGAYQLRANYLVGADGGTSPTRKLAGIDFPGMSSYDTVVRMAFDVLPPEE